jgi:hypothetical protein
MPLVLSALVGVLALRPAIGSAADEQTFPLLQIGTRTYTNVTVTTKARKYIFILHSTGMANIRVADLPPEAVQALGYNDLEKKEEAKTAKVSAWARNTLARFESPKVMALEKQVAERWGSHSPEELKAMIPAHKKTILLVLGSLLVIYLAASYCWMLICRKTGHEPGFLIWLPLLQIFPVLRSVGMSPLWFLALIVPVVNIIPFIVLCFRLAKARGKSPFVGFLFAFPVTTFFAFLYLAFSEAGAKGQPARRGVPIMRLGAA